MWSLLGTAHALEDRLEAAFDAVGLSLPKFNVLKTLVDAGEPLPLGELATRLNCVRSNITQLVDRLEADRLIRRIADPVDRRSIQAELTPLGLERYDAGAEKLDQVQQAFGTALQGQDHASLQRTLAALR